MTPIRSSPSRWLWGLLAAVVAGLIWWHATILLPFVVSIILAYVLRPAVDAGTLSSSIKNWAYQSRS